MRALLTGASGFVGGWLRAHLESMGDEVLALSDAIDIAVPGAARQEIAAARPEVIYHLAALTHVGRSWEAPQETFRVNVLGTIELFELVRELDPLPRVLLVSSAEVYGSGEGSVLTEEAPFRPVTPYAASKVAAEVVGLQSFLGRGIEVVRARPFNHVGPRQADQFVVSALARRIAEAERDDVPEIRVGNLSAERDFADVRDVVRAYRELAIHGVPGEVYNVCSGSARSIASLLDALVELADHVIEPVIDSALFRPVDVPSIVGSAARLSNLTGWAPRIPIEETLADVLAYWRTELER